MIEPWLCSRATPFTDALCQQAIPRGIRALKILMEQECPASRDEMAWVSLCGGLALANAGLGVIHGLAGPLGGLSRASHGALCGSLLPFGLALNESQINDPGLRLIDEGQPGQPERRTAAGDAGGGVGVSAPG